MTTIDLQKYIGKKGIMKVNGLEIDVKIIDAKFSYGNYRYLVTPVSGKGEVWIEKVTVKE